MPRRSIREREAGSAFDFTILSPRYKKSCTSLGERKATNASSSVALPAVTSHFTPGFRDAHAQMCEASSVFFVIVERAVFHEPGGSTTTKVNVRPPRVSVLMTVWNCEAFLADAIESVFAQTTAESWELLIVDDGSTDRSLPIAQTYALKHAGCVRVLRHPAGRNRGISASRNLALEHARGEFLAFLDADDVYLPHHLQAQLDVLRKHPEAAMVYGAAERWCDAQKPYDRLQSERAWWGQNYTPPLVPSQAVAGLLQHGTLLRWFLEDESMVPCICTVLVRREAAQAVNGFENPFRGLYDDQVFHAKLSLHHLIFANEECVARYRQHGHSCCASGRADIAKQQAALKTFRAWLLRYAQRELCRGARQQKASESVKPAALCSGMTESSGAQRGAQHGTQTVPERVPGGDSQGL